MYPVAVYNHRDDIPVGPFPPTLPGTGSSSDKDSCPFSHRARGAEGSRRGDGPGPEGRSSWERGKEISPVSPSVCE